MISGLVQVRIFGRRPTLLK